MRHIFLFCFKLVHNAFFFENVNSGPNSSKVSFSVKWSKVLNIVKKLLKKSRLGQKIDCGSKLSQISIWDQNYLKCQCRVKIVELADFGTKLSKMSILGQNGCNCWSYVKCVEIVSLGKNFRKYWFWIKLTRNVDD